MTLTVKRKYKVVPGKASRFTRRHTTLRYRDHQSTTQMPFDAKVLGTGTYFTLKYFILLEESLTPEA